MKDHDDGHFDAWSRTYERSLMQTAFFGPVQRSLVSAVSPRLDPRAVLDIGCGTGRLLERICSAFPRGGRLRHAPVECSPRPGGVLALADPAPDAIPAWQAPLRNWVRRDRHMVPLQERNALLAGAGLEVLDVSRTFLGRWVPLTLARRPTGPAASLG
jgi:trans-aconitate methyltransferase